MIQRWMKRSGTQELYLVFGGWALDTTPFEVLEGNRDVLFVGDYTHLNHDLPELEQYERVCLIAFSLGVVSAVHWLTRADFRPARLVAVSGTLFPADKERGIVPDRIRATADRLNKVNFTRFCSRAGLSTPPQLINIEKVRTELYAIISRGPAPQYTFDRIWIPDHDRIIPTRAQERAWILQKHAIRKIPAPHVPFRAGQSWSEWTT